MSKLKDALWQNYEEVQKNIKEDSLNSETYKTDLEERDKIRKELIELEKIEKDTDVKYEQIKSEENVKMEQIGSENKREKLRNWITVGTFLISACIGLGLSIKTFKFDEGYSMTSTLGKGILNNAIPKWFKRQ